MGGEKSGIPVFALFAILANMDPRTMSELIAKKKWRGWRELPVPVPFPEAMLPSDFRSQRSPKNLEKHGERASVTRKPYNPPKNAQKPVKVRGTP